MEVIPGSAQLTAPPRRAVVTVGTFDGLHVGHRALMRTVVERARAQGGRSVVYTFDPHPRKWLGKADAPGLLMTQEQKIEGLAALGIDLMVVERFDAAFAATGPESFVRDVLHARLRPVEVYVGYNFRFGHDREGSLETLARLAPSLGFEATILPEVTVEGEHVSSTRIRRLLAAGDVEAAARLLGRAYAVRGFVASGDRRGRTLRFPTANLSTENEVLPETGVYAGRLQMLDDGDPGRGTSLPVVTNVGRRPTFKPHDPLLAESHVIDFSGDLYGRRVELAFTHRLREERRFESTAELRAQIARDVERAKSRLAEDGA